MFGNALYLINLLIWLKQKLIRSSAIGNGYCIKWTKLFITTYYSYNEVGGIIDEPT